MTFDDGADSQFRTSHEDFRSKVAALLEESGTSFREACKTAGLDPAAVQNALERGTYGMPGTLTVINQFLAQFGVGIDWLLAPTGPEVPGCDEKRLKLRKLTWDFMLRDAKFPSMDRRPFVNYVLSLLDARQTSTMRLAARTAIPRTMVDLAFLYDRLVKEGFFKANPESEDTQA